MPGLPRKSTAKQFKRLMKKSGKARTNVSSGAKDPSTRKIATYEQFISMMEGVKWYKNGKLGPMEENDEDNTNNLNRDFVWTMATGKKYKIKFLETNHLENIIKYINHVIDYEKLSYERNENPKHLDKIDEYNEKLNIMEMELKYRSESDYSIIEKLLPIKLSKFLIDKKILAKYIYYLENYRNKFEDPKNKDEEEFITEFPSYKEFFEEFKESSFFDTAFDWSDTEEGFEYWLDIDREYQDSI